MKQPLITYRLDFPLRKAIRLCSLLLVLVTLNTLDSNAQVVVELEVTSGTSNSTCTDSMSPADNHWRVQVNQANWFTYPSVGGCFNNTPTIQYQDSFYCSPAYPSQFEVCYQSFENDSSGCLFGPSCLADTCDSFTIPSAGQSINHSLQIPNCCGNTSWGSVNFTVSAAGTFLEDSSISLQSACDSFYWAPADSMFYVTTIYSETFTNIYGCDSVKTLNLDMSYSNGFTSTITACDSYTWAANGNTLDTSGVYVDTIINSNGCDSVATLELTIVSSDTQTLVQSSCDNYIWPFTGDTLTSSGFYFDTLSNTSGCDSLIILDLTIFQSSTSLDIQTACDSFFWPTSGLSYFSSGLYIDTLVNTAGCDSVVTLDLIINPSFDSVLQVSVCDSFFWDVTGISYYTSGTFADTNTNVFGCDSIITLDLYIEESFYDLQTVLSCASYTWAVNDVTYSSDGSYTEAFTTSLGCDSIHQLELTVDDIDANVELASSGEGLICTTTNVDYQWLECIASQPTIAVEEATNALFEPTNSGFFAVAVSGENCSDTSNCYFLEATGNGYIARDASVRVFPNPTNGNLNIEFGQLSNGQVILTDLQGRVIMQKSFKGTSTLKMNLNVPSGLYYLSIATNHSDKSYRPIIKI